MVRPEARLSIAGRRWHPSPATSRAPAGSFWSIIFRQCSNVAAACCSRSKARWSSGGPLLLLRSVRVGGCPNGSGPGCPLGMICTPCWAAMAASVSSAFSISASATASARRDRRARRPNHPPLLHHPDPGRAPPPTPPPTTSATPSKPSTRPADLRTDRPKSGHTSEGDPGRACPGPPGGQPGLAAETLAASARNSYSGSVGLPRS